MHDVHPVPLPHQPAMFRGPCPVPITVAHMGPGLPPASGFQAPPPPHTRTPTHTRTHRDLPHMHTYVCAHTQQPSTHLISFTHMRAPWWSQCLCNARVHTWTDPNPKPYFSLRACGTHVSAIYFPCPRSLLPWSVYVCVGGAHRSVSTLLLFVLLPCPATVPIGLPRDPAGAPRFY